MRNFIILCALWISSLNTSFYDFGTAGLLVSTDAPSAILEPLQFSLWDLVLSLAWSPDGELLAVSSGTWVHFYSIPQGKFIYETNLGSFSPGLVFSPGGGLAALGSRDGKIRLWEISSDETSLQPIRLITEIQAHSKGVNSVVFNPSGEWLASGGNDAIARIWDVKTGELLNEMIGGTFAVPAVAFLHVDNGPANLANDMVAIINGDVLRLRDALSGRFTGTFWSDQPLFRLVFSPDGRLLATGDIANGVQLWDVSQAYRTGSEAYPRPVNMSYHSGTPGKPSGLVWAVAFDPSGQYLASAGGDGLVFLWDVAGGELVKVFEGHQAAVTCLAFSPDGEWLASGSLDASVRFWQVH